MSSPVVVQGTTVSPAQNTAIPSGNDEGSQPNEASKTGCKDPFFALLFYINVGAILAVVGVYGGVTMDGQSTQDIVPYIAPFVLVGALSFVASLAGLFMLMSCPQLMIKAGLLFALVMSAVWAVYAFIYVNFIYGILGVFFFMLTLCYVKAVWARIPFAAINMLTAGTAIKANLGVGLFSIIFTLVEFAWVIIWSIGFAGVFSDVEYDENGQAQLNYGLLFLLFFSLFFTQQVLESCVHVTVAGTVATWWVAPEESGCCSKAVCNSFIRTITTSFGSICFGSLLVALIRALESLASSARNNDDGGILACIAQCILSCLASIVEYFNKWAFIYVGVYGFSYIESGKAVMQLFANRGWEAVIADDLVGGAIFLLCIVLGLIVGGLSVAFTNTPLFEPVANGSASVVFFIGFIPSVLICSILLSTISSGVNTVIVMFADAPAEFQRNHPELSAKMRETWQQFYPGSI